MTTRTTDEQSVACTLLDRYSEEAFRRGAPVWLEWRGAGTHEVEDRVVAHPEGLLGHLVGTGWEGAAVVGTGRLRRLDEAHEPPAALVPGFAGGLVLACVVSRRGRVGWRMRLPDGAFYDRVPEEGFMLDVLRRSLGLATPPPPASPSVLELAAWCGAIAAASRAAGRRLDWEECLALHPAMSDEAPLPAAEAEAFLCSVAFTLDWESLRRFVASGAEADFAPPARVAEWMDSGMFARWMLDGVPPLESLLSASRPQLGATACGRLAHIARVLDDRRVGRPGRANAQCEE